MKANERAKGARKPRSWHAHPTDPVRTVAYDGLKARMIRRVGIAYWGELAEFAYWCYDTLNPLLYHSRIAHPLFQFCKVMPYGHCIGLSYTDDLDRPVIDVFRSLWTNREDWPLPYFEVFHVVTHEMMHFDSCLRLRQVGAGRWRTSHNNEFWYAGVEAASPALRVDLGLMEKPYEQWPREGWTERQRKTLNQALRKRRFPF
jgi:hypothetical protein